MRTQYQPIALLFFGMTCLSAYGQNAGINTTTPEAAFHVREAPGASLESGDAVVYSEYTGSNLAHVIAVKGKSKPADGGGIGGFFEGGYQGVQGHVNGTGTEVYVGTTGYVAGPGTGTFYGVLGQASGAGTNAGVIGYATNGTQNWAGWFPGGDVIIEDRVGIGLLNPGFAIDISKPQAVTRMTTTSALNGSVLELRSTVGAPNYVGAINFSTEAGVPGQVGYLGTNQMTFRIAGAEMLRLGQSKTGLYTSAPQHPVHIALPSGTTLADNEPLMHVEYTGTNSDDAIAIRAKCKPVDFFGIGGEFEGGYIGMRGKVHGTGTNNQYYAVRGEATGSAGTKYGVYGVASGAGTNWAGYFEGRVYAGSGIGIARTPLTNMLEIEGNASKSSAGDWLANSDARLKKNIAAMDPQETLHKMLSLQGVTYEWNDTSTGSQRPEGVQYGFTAQNIREVFPSLVEEDALGYLQTAYGTYDAMMVEALRALQEQIDVLKSENAELKSIVLQLQAGTAAH